MKMSPITLDSSMVRGIRAKAVGAEFASIIPVEKSMGNDFTKFGYKKMFVSGSSFVKGENYVFTGTSDEVDAKITSIIEMITEYY
jgi:hypothetical protein